MVAETETNLFLLKVLNRNYLFQRGNNKYLTNKGRRRVYRGEGVG